ncbi:MAG: hypothetical protein HKP10_07555 [Kiritimatiellales bacterium]|nr:hypothetical protein [Kiritimatiellales bacterium]
MKKVILGIHGLGNKPDAMLLHDWWLSAINEGLERIGKPRQQIPFKMVYWADISNTQPLDPAITDPEDEYFLREPYTKLRFAPPSGKYRRVHAQVLRFIEEHLDKLFMKKTLAEKFPGASAKIMERYFSELNTYFNHECITPQNQDCSNKAAIQTRLRDVLREYAGYDILLLAHSMGSIIALDVLWDSSLKQIINTFVTLGSPLGMPPIVARNFKAQKALLPDLIKPQAPECVAAHWYNISDRRDTIALDHTLRDDYGSNQNGVKAIDLMVKNDYAFKGEPNPHKSFGYLRARETAGIIDAFLAG